MILKVEVLEETGITEAGVKFKKGSVVVCDEPHEIAMGNRWVNLGWAKNVETGEVGERKEGVNTITPDKAVTNITNKKKG